MQRKNSLPEASNLNTATALSQRMSREEISALSSSRRDNVRRQLEDIERYKNNPLLYIFNPAVQVINLLINLIKLHLLCLLFQDWIQRQKLILIVVFVNIFLAFMFFKLLT